ncbi:hypothetical protein [Terrabacter tumescens]|uniref:hypothetical protein n=1 Tax=Terrabacter tumescens TaxID=60443 RepID=UPI0004C15ACE|nr:hypothetical protein [Terrabacter tumescens]
MTFTLRQALVAHGLSENRCTAYPALSTFQGVLAWRLRLDLVVEVEGVTGFAIWAGLLRLG